jgi:hypothetical protein
VCVVIVVHHVRELVHKCVTNGFVLPEARRSSVEDAVGSPLAAVHVEASAHWQMPTNAYERGEFW